MDTEILFSVLPIMTFVFALLVLALQKISINFKEGISIHSLAPIVEYIGEPL